MTSLNKLRLLLILIKTLLICSCSKHGDSPQQNFPSKTLVTEDLLSEEGRQNLARFSHGEEPYLSLIRTTQLLDHLQIKGWSLRHVTLPKFSVYLTSNGKTELFHSSTIKQKDYPYLFMMIDEELEIFELSNTSSVSVSVPINVPSGKFRVEPIPDKKGRYELYLSYDQKHQLVIELSDD
ncbi:MAG: hypothetical protein AAGA96_02690 [Verrucomicrobiota bacterium]